MKIPSEVYVGVGALVLANVSTIITILVFIFKGGRWVGTTEARVDQVESDINAAHEKIRFIKALIIKEEK